MRDRNGETAFGVEVDLDRPPTVVKSSESKPTAVSLDWDRAIDDEKHLRRCPVCGCPDLFAKKSIPQLRIFVLLVAAAVAAMVLYGFNLIIPAVIVFVLLLSVDVVIYLFAPRSLQCYQCRSGYKHVSIRKDHPKWQASIAERYKTNPAWKRREEP